MTEAGKRRLPRVVAVGPGDRQTLLSADAAAVRTSETGPVFGMNHTGPKQHEKQSGRSHGKSPVEHQGEWESEQVTSVRPEVSRTRQQTTRQRPENALASSRLQTPQSLRVDRDKLRTANRTTVLSDHQPVGKDKELERQGLSGPRDHGRKMTGHGQFQDRTVLTTLGLAQESVRVEPPTGPLRRSGQEQRVGIARAIVAHPKVVVADEPTGDLDPDTSGQILNLLKRLKEQLNVTLLMVTHDADAAEIADQQFRLDHGKLVQTGGAGFQPTVFREAQETAG